MSLFFAILTSLIIILTSKATIAQGMASKTTKIKGPKGIKNQ
jgi:hypothetical protein